MAISDFDFDFDFRRIMIMSAIFFASVQIPAEAMPPENPLQCNQTGCTLSNSYGVWGDRKPCHVSAVVYPATEAELRSAVADASRRKLRVKVVSRFAHTIPKLTCPSPRGGGGGTVLISTERYNSTVAVDRARLAVTADAGVGLRELIDRVEAEGLSLVAAPYWEGVSVAGAISTGAHGSSWWGHGGALHDHVIGIRVVAAAGKSEGFAKVVDLGEGDPLFNAAKVSLGLLGVISKVTFALEPAFKRVITYNFSSSDEGIEDEFMNHARKYEFGDLQWYPSKHTVVYRYDDRVSLYIPGNGANDFIGFQSNYAILGQALRRTEKAAEKSRSTGLVCDLASSFLVYKKLTANGLKSDGKYFFGYPVVGRQGRMQTSGSCLYSSESDKSVSCAWDPRIGGLSFFESTAIFSPTKFRLFVSDVKRLCDVNPDNFCGVDAYNGFLIRFVKKSDAYLGQPEDSIVVDFNYFRSDEGLTPRLNEDVWEEVEQMAFFKYGARPHWGKNRKVAFLGVDKKFPRFREFVEARKVLDPDGMFSSETSDEIVFGREGLKEDGCALEGLCVCEEDRHCSPRNGYFCRRGLVYEEARVCRFSSNITSIS